MVREEIQDFLLLTEQLHDMLEQEVTVKNRSATIDKIVDYLDQREQIIKKIVPPYTEEEISRGRKIVSLNKEIDKKVNKIFQQLKLEIKQTRQQKRSNESYENPYKSVQVMDGMFLDQKK